MCNTFRIFIIIYNSSYLDFLNIINECVNLFSRNFLELSDDELFHHLTRPVSIKKIRSHARKIGIPPLVIEVLPYLLDSDIIGGHRVPRPMEVFSAKLEGSFTDVRLWCRHVRNCYRISGGGATST